MATTNKDLKFQTPNKPRQKLLFSVVIPPSSNNAFYNGRRGIKSHAKLWMARCKAHVLKIIEESGWQHENEQVWFYVDLIYYFP